MLELTISVKSMYISSVLQINIKATYNENKNISEIYELFSQWNYTSLKITRKMYDIKFCNMVTTVISFVITIENAFNKTQWKILLIGFVVC